MAVLEFIQVMVAVILGLGIAEILRGFADFLRPGERRVSLLLLTISAWLLLVHIQFWWAGWRLVDVESWKFYELLLYLAGPIILFLLARLSFPNTAESQDLTKYYADVSARIWYLVGAFFVFAIPFNTVLLDAALISSGPISQIALLSYALICANTSNRTVHFIGVAGLVLQATWRGISDVVGS